MTFDEIIAKEIIEKFSLSEKTLPVWRNRGSIPDKYSKANYVKQAVITSKKDLIMQNRISLLIKSKKIETGVLNDLCGLRTGKLTDVALGKSTFSEEDIIRVKAEIIKLKNKTKKALEALKYENKRVLDDYFNNNAINILALCDYNRDIQSRIIRSKNSKLTNFPFQHKIEIEKYFYVFLLELNF